MSQDPKCTRRTETIINGNPLLSLATMSVAKIIIKGQVYRIFLVATSTAFLAYSWIDAMEGDGYLIVDNADNDASNAWLALGLSAAAGISTSIGGLLPFFISIEDIAWLSISLAFSAGVMIYVSFVEIFHEAVERFEEDYSHRQSTLYATIGFFAGVALCAFLDMIVHHIDPSHEHHSVESFNDIENHLKRHHDLVHKQSSMSMEDHRQAHLEEAHREGSHRCSLVPESEMRIVTTREEVVKLETENDLLCSHDKGNCLCRQGYTGICAGEGLQVHQSLKPASKSLMKLSLISALAIALHNFPEGIATFISSLESPKLGFTIALAIAIHNIPEGICVAIPVYYSTGSKVKAVLWATLAGIAEPLGALFALIILKTATDGSFSPTSYGTMFSLVAGMMVFISFAELLPTAQMYDHKNNLVTKATILGMVVMALSLVLFAMLHDE